VLVNGLYIKWEIIRMLAGGTLQFRLPANTANPFVPAGGI